MNIGPSLHYIMKTHFSRGSCRTDGKEFVSRLSGLCSFRQGLASPARVHVLLQQRVRSRILRLQSKQLVDCLLRNQLSPTDLVPEIAPRFSGPCRFFEQSLILATHHYWGGELLRHGFSPSQTPYAFQFGCLHFGCRTGKSRVLCILSPDVLVMEKGSSRQKRTFRVSLLYFLHRCSRRQEVRASPQLGLP